MDELSELEEWVGPLLARLGPAGRRAVAMDVGRALRKSQQQRIAAQLNPDGSAYAPRKKAGQGKNLREKKGRIKRQAMFAKMRMARLFKVESDAQGVAIGWAGRVARIARVHQEGLASEVKPGGPKYKYPVRQLLGLSQPERDMIRDKLLEHLAGS